MTFCQSPLGRLLGHTNFPQANEMTRSGTELLLYYIVQERDQLGNSRIPRLDDELGEGLGFDSREAEVQSFETLPCKCAVCARYGAYSRHISNEN